MEGSSPDSASSEATVLFSGSVERGRVVGALPKPRLEAEVEKALALAHGATAHEG